ncbi:hypothetical protein ACO1K4_14365, partial [Staphylococcus aureus]
SNRHYNAYWRGPNKEADEKSAYNNVQVGDGSQQREIGIVISTDNASWRGPNKFKIQCVILICYYYDNLQNYMKNE